MSDNKRAVGGWGERVAQNYLERKGYAFVARNYTTRFGELDLIMRDGNTFVFVEVKLRKNREFADARDFVTKAKQRRLRTTAQIWLTAHDPDAFARFDVVEIYAPQGDKTERMEINHIEEAFV